MNVIQIFLKGEKMKKLKPFDFGEPFDFSCIKFRRLFDQEKFPYPIILRKSYHENDTMNHAKSNVMRMA